MHLSRWERTWNNSLIWHMAQRRGWGDVRDVNPPPKKKPMKTPDPTTLTVGLSKQMATWHPSGVITRLFGNLWAWWNFPWCPRLCGLHYMIWFSWIIQVFELIRSYDANLRGPNSRGNKAFFAGLRKEMILFLCSPFVMPCLLVEWHWGGWAPFGLKEPGPEVRRRRAKMETVGTQTDQDPAPASWATAFGRWRDAVGTIGVVHQAIFQSLTSSIRQPSLFSFWWDGSAKKLLHTWSRLGHLELLCFLS